MIDMGSNSWRLVVYGYEPGTPWWSLVDEIREPVRVSAGMAEEGAIRPERFELALHTAAVFSAFCRASGVDEIEAVATSAIRDARNGPDLLERIDEHSGLVPRVISGGEEAGYGSLAIVNSTTIEDGCGLDMGGGSIQAIRIEDRRDDRLDLAPARLGSRERGLPPRREGHRQVPEGPAPARGRRARRRGMVGGRRDGSWAPAGRSATWPRPP